MDVATAPSAIKPPEMETNVYNNSTMSAETEKLAHSMETAGTDTSGHFTVVSRLCIVQSCHNQMYTVKVGQRFRHKMTLDRKLVLKICDTSSVLNCSLFTEHTD